MKTFKEYLIEAEGGGLTIFDIDDTLFHTFAMIKVIKDGKTVGSLTNQEFNVNKLADGEEYDFGEFRDAKRFRETSKPVERMFAKAKAILKNVLNKPGSDMIIITARSDFDNKHTFLQAFKDQGFPIEQVHVERAGNLGSGPSAPNKVKIIKRYLEKGKYTRVRLFDDAMSNLKAMLDMKKDYPNVSFEAYLANQDGSIKTIK